VLTPTVQEALNEQINTEFASAYAYLAMSAYCERQNFRGCAHWLRLQSNEEYAHGIKLYNFMTARNAKVVFKQIPAPQTDYDSIVDVFKQAMDQEMAVSQRLDALYELAFKEKNFAALVELQWFITEQVEEEHTAREILAKFQLVKNDPSALLDLDRELGGRPAVQSVPGGESTP
jgi:ferritin